MNSGSIKGFIAKDIHEQWLEIYYFPSLLHITFGKAKEYTSASYMREANYKVNRIQRLHNITQTKKQTDKPLVQPPTNKPATHVHTNNHKLQLWPNNLRRLRQSICRMPLVFQYPSSNTAQPVRRILDKQWCYGSDGRSCFTFTWTPCITGWTPLT